MNHHTSQAPDHLLALIQQVKRHYKEIGDERKKRGKPRTYSSLSFLVLAIVAVTLRTFKERELHRLLLHDEGLRQTLGFARVPHRRTIERRLQSLISEAEAQIAATGERIVEEVRLADEHSQISAIDGRMYEAQGPRWHKQHRELGIIPTGLRNVDTDSSWSKSGYRGWVQGYRLVLQTLVFPEPVPLTAFWRANTEGEATVMAAALAKGRFPVTSVLLGDETFGGAQLGAAYAEQGGWLLTPRQLPTERRSWKHDLFAYRKETIELLFQRVIQACDLKTCPVKGLQRNGAFVLASVWLYQCVFLTNYRQGTTAAQVKEQIDKARWRIAA
ncbi:MAG: hypothetical protein M3458_09455 [Acidobacteriota bacterium]|nr:hypothetical protein [Acidobacteriota bacterium]